MRSSLASPTNKDHFKMQTPTNLEINYPVIISKKGTKNDTYSSLPSSSSTQFSTRSPVFNDPKSKPLQGTGEKAKEVIKSPALDLKRFNTRNTVTSNPSTISHSYSVTSTTKTSKKILTIPQSNSNKNKNVEDTNENSIQRDTFNSKSLPLNSTINQMNNNPITSITILSEASNVNNDDDNNNDNNNTLNSTKTNINFPVIVEGPQSPTLSANSTHSSSTVKPTTMSPLLRSARLILSPRQVPISINDPSLKLDPLGTKKSFSEEMTSQNSNISNISRNTLYQDKYAKSEAENKYLKSKLDNAYIEMTREMHLLESYELLVQAMFDTIDILSFNISQDDTILHYGLLQKKSTRLMGGYDQRYVVILPGKLVWFKDKTPQLSQNEILKNLSNSNYKYISLDSHSYATLDDKISEVFIVYYNKLIQQHPIDMQANSTYDNEDISSQLSNSMNDYPTLTNQKSRSRHSISSDVEINNDESVYPKSTSSTNLSTMETSINDRKIVFKCSTVSEASVFIDVIRVARDIYSDVSDDMMKRFNTIRNDMIEHAESEEFVTMYLRNKLNQPISIPVNFIKEKLSLPKGFYKELTFTQILKDVKRDKIIFNNRVYTENNGNTESQMIYTLISDLYQSFPNNKKDVYSSTRLMAAIKYMIYLSCRSQCSGDSLEGLKYLLGCDPIHDPNIVISQQQEQPETRFSIENDINNMQESKANGPYIRFESTVNFNISTTKKKYKPLYLAEVISEGYISLTRLISYKLRITFKNLVSE